MFARGVVLVYRPPPPCLQIPLLLVWRRWWARSWLRRWWVAALLSLWLLRRRPSTRDPSHEHSLVRLGAGGGLSIGAGCGRSMSWAWGRSSSVRVPCRPSSGGGVWRRVVGLGVVGVGPGIVVPLSFPLLSSPCRSFACGPLFAVFAAVPGVVPPSGVVSPSGVPLWLLFPSPVVVPPAYHPTSSCSRGWERVVCRSCSGWRPPWCSCSVRGCSRAGVPVVVGC
jgi:hypothetical protein